MANLKVSEKDRGSLQGQVDALSEQLASQKVSHDQLQTKYDEEKTAHIRSESRIETLNTELEKKR